MKEIKLDNLFNDLASKDNSIRQNAFQALLRATENKVDWVYIKWFEFLDMLKSKNSFHRSISLLLLANLAKSDIDNKFNEILIDYLQFFNDEKFITSRQCIQNVWKVAVAKESSAQRILDELEKTYYENIHITKHGNLIKQDVISSMFQIYTATGNETVKMRLNKLILSENDLKLIKSLQKIII